MKTKKSKKMNINQNEHIKSLNKGYNSNDCRKIVYERIDIIKNEKEGTKYVKGPSMIKNIRKENNINKQYNKEVSNYKNILKKGNNKDDYSIQNFIIKESKDDKIGPKFILTKKMNFGKL